MGRFYLILLNKLSGNYPLIVSCTLESELVTGALILGQVTVFKSFLSRNSKHSHNLYQVSKLSQGNNSTNQSIPVNEGYFTNDQILKVITGDRGYSFQTDEHPIEMVEAGCRTGRALCITGIKWIIGVKIPFTVTVLKNWRNGCLRIFWTILIVNRGPTWNDRCWTGGLVYWFWICRWSVVWKLFWDSKTVLAIFVRCDMDILIKSKSP